MSINMSNLQSALYEAAHSTTVRGHQRTFQKGESTLLQLAKANDDRQQPNYIVITPEGLFSITSDRKTATPMNIVAEKIDSWVRTLDPLSLSKEEKISLTSIRESLSQVLYHYKLQHAEPEIVSRMQASLGRLRELDNVTRNVSFSPVDTTIERDESRVESPAKHPMRESYPFTVRRERNGRLIDPREARKENGLPLAPTKDDKGRYLPTKKETSYSLHMEKRSQERPSLASSINCSDKAGAATEDEDIDTSHISRALVDLELQPARGSALKPFAQPIPGPAIEPGDAEES